MPSIFVDSVAASVSGEPRNQLGGEGLVSDVVREGALHDLGELGGPW